MTTPFVVTLVLTHACNLACGYCYMGEHHRTSMSEEIARRGLDLAFGFGGPVDVSFFGGEPLLERERLVDIASRARSMGERASVDVRFQMTTNGTLLTPEVLGELEALDVHVTLSFDGDRAAHEPVGRGSAVARASTPSCGPRSSCRRAVGGSMSSRSSRPRTSRVSAPACGSSSASVRSVSL